MLVDVLNRKEYEMTKKLLLSVAALLTLTSAVEANRCKDQRKLGGVVSFPTIINQTGQGCDTILTAASNIVTGKNCFSVSPATINVNQVPAGCNFCPTNEVTFLISFNVTFCKPFAFKPAVTVVEEIPNNAGTSFNFPVGPGGIQTACDNTTFFVISINTSNSFVSNVTNNGFTFNVFTNFAGCGANTLPDPDSNAICNVGFLIAASLITQLNFHFNAIGF